MCLLRKPARLTGQIWSPFQIRNFSPVNGGDLGLITIPDKVFNQIISRGVKFGKISRPVTETSGGENQDLGYCTGSSSHMTLQVLPE